METVMTLDLEKGEFMEEQLRAYFLDLGYYVVRGAKLKFQGVEVTDIDLWLYHRTTAISRERINVDIKNKARPVAIERIIVAKGIMNILNFDRCIVATTDKRDDIIDFGKKHEVLVLNGNFLNRIKRLKTDRLSEEAFTLLLKDEFSKFTTNWFSRSELAKSRLLENLDFITANDCLIDIKSLLEQIHSTPLKRDPLIRLLYLFISYLLVTIDYLMKEYAFIEISQKLKNLEDGFRYGVIGGTRIKQRLEQMTKSTGLSFAAIKSTVDQIPVDILREYFGKNETTKNLFVWAKDLETYAYSTELLLPTKLPAEIKGSIGVMCDFSGVDRKLILSL